MTHVEGTGQTLNDDLRLSSYDFHLPEDLIAQRPAPSRDESRLLVYIQEQDKVIHDHFYNLDQYLPEDSHLFLNQSCVFPCRLLGNKETGGRVEVFFLTLVPDSEKSYHCLLKSSSKKLIGMKIIFPHQAIGTVAKNNEDGTFQILMNIGNLETYLQENALIPIPPYIRGGNSDAKDESDYQTTYAKNDLKDKGSVAAPTAGLHFTSDVFKKLKAKNILPHYLTLHVGMGTFAPVKTENVLEHKMHKEEFYFPSDTLEAYKDDSKKRFCVGTTSLRALESVYEKRDELKAGEFYPTDIFLYPGKEVKSIDGLITNFHLPKSTLLMLVSSLIGREKTLELYEEAIKNKYRFFSYGDAMLILRGDVKDHKDD